MGMMIRPWQKRDLATISRMTLQSWLSTYTNFIPEGDIRSYFDDHYTEASLLRMFNDPFVHGFVAEMEGNIVGYARLDFDPDEHRLSVPSLHVLSRFQGQGIGRQLLEAAERHAGGKGLDELWIGAMIKNRKALALYRKMGFLFVHEEPFTVGHTTVGHLMGFKKLGRSPLLGQKTYATFEGRENPVGLPELCFDLRSEQQETWEDLRQGDESFRGIRERDLDCGTFPIRLQYNPRRIKSSTADVGPKNRTGRRCFLCLDQIPEGQKGILYRREYLVLCNPMPILTSHFTVSHVDHRPQAVDGHIDILLLLMADLGPGWTVLYNGPKCGASAPDHFHFQAALSGKMPMEKNLREEKRHSPARQVDGTVLYRAKELGREVVVLEGRDPAALEVGFKRFLDALRKVLLGDDEPMINIAGFYDGKKWRLAVFPRRKHRPDAFFKEGEARRVISPGAIDMGGLLITPVVEDFERLDAAAVEGIYKEVSLEGEIVGKAIDAIPQNPQY
jgi:ribosomal protein S18 acetylase RimI-like enzyme